VHQLGDSKFAKKDIYSGRNILEETACSRLELSDIIEGIKVPLFLGISGFVDISIIPENEELFLIF
jgi:hypothetical protein